VLGLVEQFYPHAQIPPKVSLGVTSILEEMNVDMAPPGMLEER
jgi:hypothetical protein